MKADRGMNRCPWMHLGADSKVMVSAVEQATGEEGTPRVCGARLIEMEPDPGDGSYTRITLRLRADAEEGSGGRHFGIPLGQLLRR